MGLIVSLINYTKPPPTNWLDLPFEIHENIINYMDPKNSCRFAEVSKTTEKEVKGSRNYLYSIKAFETFERDLALELVFDKCSGGGYKLEFVNAKHCQTIVIYRSIHGDQGAKWIKLESGDPRLVRASFAKEYLEQFKNSIRSIRLEGDFGMICDFNLNNLRKLDHISIYNKLIVYNRVPQLGNRFIEMNKLLRIEKIDMPGVIFTFDQIAQFKGKEAYIASDEFDEENIKKYLKMWKNGMIHENVEAVEIKIEILGDVTLRNITEGLDVYDYEENISGIVECWFCSRCNVRGNRTFRVSYQPSYQLQVAWIP